MFTLLNLVFLFFPQMSFRGKDTYDDCSYYHYWSCFTGNCGSATRRQITEVDFSTNTPSYENQWCEMENVETWRVPSDKPFQLRLPYGLNQMQSVVPVDKEH
ncbi:hypothetical protein ILYODFUR_035998 [Ilyodon furcidens]|uniref:Uncharacterized protein n=1 Tax=Ilyodon furcidens TaxID=33524 RepID=A0ABV0V0X2_9TELE